MTRSDSASAPPGRAGADARPDGKEDLRFTIGGKQFTYRGLRAHRERDFFQLFLKTQKGADAPVGAAIDAFRANMPESSSTDEELAVLYQRHCRRRAERDRRQTTFADGSIEGGPPSVAVEGGGDSRRRSPQSWASGEQGGEDAQPTGQLRASQQQPRGSSNSAGALQGAPPAAPAPAPDPGEDDDDEGPTVIVRDELDDSEDDVPADCGQSPPLAPPPHPAPYVPQLPAVQPAPPPTSDREGVSPSLHGYRAAGVATAPSPRVTDSDVQPLVHSASVGRAAISPTAVEAAPLGAGGQPRRLQPLGAQSAGPVLPHAAPPAPPATADFHHGPILPPPPPPPPQQHIPQQHLPASATPRQRPACEAELMSPSPVGDAGASASTPLTPDADVQPCGSRTAAAVPGWGGPPTRRENTGWERELTRRSKRRAGGSSGEGPAQTRTGGGRRPGGYGSGQQAAAESAHRPTGSTGSASGAGAAGGPPLVPQRSSSPALPPSGQRRQPARSSGASKRSGERRSGGRRPQDEQIQQTMSELLERTRAIQDRVAELEQKGGPERPPSASGLMDSAASQSSHAAPGSSQQAQQLASDASEILDLVRRDARGRTPLHEAAERGAADEVSRLLHRGSNAEAVDCRGRTPVLCACARGLLPIVHLLGANGAELTAVDAEGVNAMGAAAAGNHAAVVEYLHFRSISPTLQDRYGRAPLHHAVLPVTEALRALLSFGVDVNVRDYRDGQTPLHRACRCGYLAAARCLLQGGAALATSDFHGDTPLALAALNMHWHVAEAVLDHDPRTLGWTALHRAAVLGHGLEQQLTAPQGAELDTDRRDAAGQSPLQLATLSGMSSRLEQLLAKGARVDHADAQGRTALHLAAARGQLELCRCLLMHRANVDVEDVHRLTPYQLALLHGRPAAAELLLAEGADPIVHPQAAFVVSLAQRQLTSRSDAVARAMRGDASRRGSDEEPSPESCNDDETCDQFGRTRLQMAAFAASEGAVRQLLEQRVTDGAPATSNLWAADVRGWTVLHWAAAADCFADASGRDVSMLPLNPTAAAGLCLTLSERKRAAQAGCVQLLLQASAHSVGRPAGEGVRVDLRSVRADDGRRAADVAVDEGAPPEVVEMLQPPGVLPERLWRCTRWLLVVTCALLCGALCAPVAALCVLLSGRPLRDAPARGLRDFAAFCRGLRHRLLQRLGRCDGTPVSDSAPCTPRRVAWSVVAVSATALLIAAPHAVTAAHTGGVLPAPAVTRTEVLDGQSNTSDFVRLYPPRLYVEVPGTNASALLWGLDGWYWLAADTDHRGLPVWEDKERIKFLFGDSRGHWVLGNEKQRGDDAQRASSTGSGWVRSQAPHNDGQLLPHQLVRWEYCERMTWEMVCLPALWRPGPGLQVCLPEYARCGDAASCECAVTITQPLEDGSENATGGARRDEEEGWLPHGSPRTRRPEKLPDEADRGGDASSGRPVRDVMLWLVAVVLVAAAAAACRRTVTDRRSGAVPSRAASQRLDFSRWGNWAMLALSVLDPLMLAALPYAVEGSRGGGEAVPQAMRALVFDTLPPLSAALVAVFLAILWAWFAGFLCVCAALSAARGLRRAVGVVCSDTLLQAAPPPLVHLLSHTLMPPVVVSVLGLYRCDYGGSGGAVMNVDPEVPCYSGQHALLAGVGGVALLAYVPSALSVGLVFGQPRGWGTDIIFSRGLLSAEKLAFLTSASALALMYHTRWACYVIYFVLLAFLILFVGRWDESPTPALPSLVQWRILGYIFGVPAAVGSMLYPRGQGQEATVLFVTSLLLCLLLSVVLYHCNRVRVLRHEREDAFRRLSSLHSHGPRARSASGDSAAAAAAIAGSFQSTAMLEDAGEPQPAAPGVPEQPSPSGADSIHNPGTPAGSSAAALRRGRRNSARVGPNPAEGPLGGVSPPAPAASPGATAARVALAPGPGGAEGEGDGTTLSTDWVMVTGTGSALT